MNLMQAACVLHKLVLSLPLGKSSGSRNSMMMMMMMLLLLLLLLLLHVR